MHVVAVAWFTAPVSYYNMTPAGTNSMPIADFYVVQQLMTRGARQTIQYLRGYKTVRHILHFVI